MIKHFVPFAVMAFLLFHFTTEACIPDFQFYDVAVNFSDSSDVNFDTITRYGSTENGSLIIQKTELYSAYKFRGTTYNMGVCLTYDKGIPQILFTVDNSLTFQAADSLVKIELRSLKNLGVILCSVEGLQTKLSNTITTYDREPKVPDINQRSLEKSKCGPMNLTLPTVLSFTVSVKHSSPQQPLRKNATDNAIYDIRGRKINAKKPNLHGIIIQNKKRVISRD